MAQYAFTFTSGDTVTPTKLNDARTVSEIVDADIDPAAGIVSTKLSTATQQSLVPAGAVMPFAMNLAPAGWLAADGTAVSRSTYAALFAAIGTTHGAGDGSTTFALPDLRGIFVRGRGSQTISGTSYSGTFATKQGAAMLNHTHSGTTSSNGNHNHTSNFKVLARGSGGDNALVGALGDDITRNTSSNGAHTHTLTTGNPSAGGGAETRPANIALLYCIKF
jgi:microcystin-dependent protein